MAWYLINEHEAVPLRNGKVVGRDDFENAPVLSRQHFKFIVKRGRLSVRDLGSRNGTLLRGEALGGENPVPLGVDDVLQVANYDFYVSWRRPTAMITWAVFAMLLAFKGADPTSGFGLSIGWLGWTYFGLSALCATVLTNLALGRLIPPRFVWPYVAAAVVIATALDMGQLFVLAKKFHLAEMVMRDRVEYFCAKNFNAQQCIRQVAICPQCTIPMAKWRRLKMAERLESTRRMPASTKR